MLFSCLRRTPSAFRMLCLALMFSCTFAAASVQAEAATRVIVVDLDQAKRLYDLGAVFIDVRSDEQWQLGRIKNAHHVNFRTNFSSLKTLEGITRQTPLVFYCASAECEIGPYAAAVSMEWGFEKVLYFEGGYFAWMLEDYPIDMKNPLSPYTGTLQIRKAPDNQGSSD